jgi:hypothetical protein
MTNGEKSGMSSGISPTSSDLTLHFTLPEGSITDYQRWLDVSRALAGVAFKLNGDTYTREVFSSAPAGVIVMKLTTGRKGGLTFDVGLSRQVSATTRAIGSDTLVMKGNTDYAPPPRQARRGAGANDPAAAPTPGPPVRPGAVGYEVQRMPFEEFGSVSHCCYAARNGGL